MQIQGTGRASGNAYLLKGKRGPVWYMRYRLDGRESRKRIGPAWTGRGRPPAGFFTKRMAEAELDAFLTDARRGVLPEKPTTATVTVEDAANEWLRHAEHQRRVKPATLADYKGAVKTHIVPAFGDRRIEDVTSRLIDRWQARLAETKLSTRTRSKLLTILHGIFERARREHGLPMNPVAGVERPRESYSGDYDFYSPEEVWALVRAAESEQDAAIFLTAAFTGLRQGELRALRWRDVDFANEVIRVTRGISLTEIGSPKGRRIRSVPMIPEVAGALAKLWQRGVFTGDDDLVFPGLRTGKRVAAVLDAEEWSEEQDEILVAEPLDRSALRRRFVAARKRAELRPIRFHDLRHTFGSLVINQANPAEVQAYLGHSDYRTTQRYLHHKSRGGEAQRIAAAFRPAQPETELERALEGAVKAADEEV
jgi:integrase